MTRTRNQLISHETTTDYHCISRSVCRTFPCGGVPPLSLFWLRPTLIRIMTCKKAGVAEATPTFRHPPAAIRQIQFSWLRSRSHPLASDQRHPYRDRRHAA